MAFRAALFLVGAGMTIWSSQLDAATYALTLYFPNTSKTEIKGSFTIPDSYVGLSKAGAFVPFTSLTSFNITVDGIRFNLPGDQPAENGGLVLDSKGQPFAFTPKGQFGQTWIYNSDKNPSGPPASLNLYYPLGKSDGSWHYNNHYSPSKTWNISGRYRFAKVSCPDAKLCPSPKIVLNPYKDHRYCKEKDKVIVGSSLMRRQTLYSALVKNCPECVQLAAVINLVPDEKVRDKLYQKVGSNLKTDIQINSWELIYKDVKWARSFKDALAEIGANVLSGPLNKGVKSLLPSKNKPSSILKKYMEKYVEELSSNYIYENVLKKILNNPCNISAEDASRAIYKYLYDKSF